MIPWWWAVVSFILGANFGLMFLGICNAGRDKHDTEE
jgi:hypothetical protein